MMVYYSCVKNYPEMRSHPPGGILGEEMGLGKTVEVLACMLHNPRENVPLPEPLPVIEGNFFTCVLKYISAVLCDVIDLIMDHQD